MRRTSSLCKSCAPPNSGGGKLNQSKNWKGGTRIKKGYVYHYIGKGKYKAEHVLVMQKHLQRELCPGENVHHINGIRDDNRIENLELWIKPQPSGIRIEDAVAWAKEILKRYEN